MRQTCCINAACSQIVLTIYLKNDQFYIQLNYKTCRIPKRFLKYCLTSSFPPYDFSFSQSSLEFLMCLEISSFSYRLSVSRILPSLTLDSTVITMSLWALLYFGKFQTLYARFIRQLTSSFIMGWVGFVQVPKLFESPFLI
uniref:Uncharacterized protein n=1 Tax=Cacopsylla melanoneura TaxID=428564 RepID=A0A8D8V2L2_9HEMI